MPSAEPPSQATVYGAGSPCIYRDGPSDGPRRSLCRRRPSTVLVLPVYIGTAPATGLGEAAVAGDRLRCWLSPYIWVVELCIVRRGAGERCGRWHAPLHDETTVGHSITIPPMSAHTAADRASCKRETASVRAASRRATATPPLAVRAPAQRALHSLAVGCLAARRVGAAPAGRAARRSRATLARARRGSGQPLPSRRYGWREGARDVGDVPRAELRWLRCRREGDASAWRAPLHDGTTVGHSVIMPPMSAHTAADRASCRRARARGLAARAIERRN